MDKIRVRFAPAPTGYLHIGGARTALFTWLFAKQNKGTFILRIDDTDEARSTEESTRGILDSMRWLGLDWDQGPEVGGPHAPYFQSERTNIYKEYIQKLLDSGHAYYCYCTKEELDAEKAKAGWDYRYSGKCYQLTEVDKRRYETEGRKPTVRLKVTGDTIVVPDLIKGYVEFKAETMDDFIIVRSNGTPLYNFTSTIDDALMQITHVIRGEDHLSNTPKQILIYQALGFEAPKFAHAPTVLDKEGKKLSKRRHGELVAIDYYQKSGYLPEAMVNFLVRLGWSYDDKEEMFTVDELIQKFDIGRVGKSASIFDIQKLQWLNREYIMKRNIHERTDLVVPFLRKAGLLNDSANNPLNPPLLRGTDAEKRIWLEKMVEAIGDRMTTLADIETHSSFFFADEPEYDEKAVQKSLKKDFVPGMLRDLKSIFSNLEPFDENTIEAKIREYAERSGLGGKVMLPTRVAITGKSTGPGLFESLALLGRDKVLQRIDKAMELL